MILNCCHEKYVEVTWHNLASYLREICFSYSISKWQKSHVVIWIREEDKEHKQMLLSAHNNLSIIIQIEKRY
jgi:hypothetical protein